MKTTNWRAMQVAQSLDVNKKPQRVKNSGVKTRGMSMGSWRANLSKGGVLR